MDKNAGKCPEAPENVVFPQNVRPIKSSDLSRVAAYSACRRTSHAHVT